MAQLKLFLLGGFQPSVDGTPVTGFDTDKTRALLAYLADESSRAHSRDALAALLWPDLPEEAARRNLRNSLYRLRQALGEGAEQQFLHLTPQTVQIDTTTAEIWLDTAAFEAIMAACKAHRHRKPAHCSTCHGQLERAIELYRGDFLSGFHLSGCQEFEEWHLLKREALHRQALDALAQLFTYHLGRGEYERALGYAYRQIELEPWREEAHRWVMRLLAQTGRRSEALAQYVACRKVLTSELDAEPSEETTALYELIKVGSPEPLDVELPRNNLPRQLAPLIGRVSELSRITSQLDSQDYGLITVIGPGGVGKTRLALQAATQQLGAFDDGVYWIPLTSAASTETVISSIAQVTGLRLHAEEDPRTQLLNYLRDKEMLLLLDNFEQLLSSGEATDLVAAILRHAPRTYLLVTSRERLSLQAEHLLDLSGLSMPEGEQERRIKGEGSRVISPFANPPVDPAVLMQSEAVQLFVERAQQSQSHPPFTLSDETAQGVADVCTLVGGLPLGIVLAAAWVRYYSPARIAELIRANLDFLTSQSRDATSQHMSLRAVFNHSWDLLSDEERRIFYSLSVFRGGWEEEAAESVAGASPLSLVSLTDKSLLRRDANGRFDMHEVLRRYATERLAELPEEQDEVKRRHAHYYLDLARTAEPELKSDRQAMWLERLEREHDNLRAVLAWANENREMEIGLLLGGALWRFWYVRGYYREGREYLAALLAMPLPQEHDRGGDRSRIVELMRARATALNGAGVLAGLHGDQKAAHSLYEESLALSRELGDKKGMASSLGNLAIIAHQQGASDVAGAFQEESLALRRELGDEQDIASSLNNLGLMSQEAGNYEKARALHEETLTLRRELGDTLGIASSLGNLGLVAQELGDYERARRLYQESLTIRRELGDKAGMAELFSNLGSIAQKQEDFDAARELYEQGLALSRELGYRWGIALLLHNLGFVAQEQGDYEKARSLHKESLALRRDSGERIGIAASLIGLGVVIARRTKTELEQKADKEHPGSIGPLERAVTIFAAVDSLLASTSSVLSVDDRELYEQNLEPVRTLLEEEVFERAWAEGRAMTLDEAVNCALQG